MRTKITAALLAVLTLLGGLNLFQSLKEKFFPEPASEIVYVEKAERVERKAKREKRERRERHEKRERHEHSSAMTEWQVNGTVMIEKQFDVSAGDLLDIDIVHSDVQIETGDYDEAHILITLEGSNMEKARATFEDMNFRVEQNGSKLLIHADSPHSRSWSRSKTGGAHITVHARIPERFDARLVSSHGNLSLAPMNGRLDFKTSHGNIRATELRGASLDLKTSHGTVRAGSLTSDQVRVRTSHGDIKLEEVNSERFNARTSHSDIQVGHLKGRSDLSTSHGDIRINLVEGADAELRTSHGNVVISAPLNLAADLNLKAERVRIASEYEFNGSLERNRADGTINGGGNRIHARTSHGSIVLRHD